MFLLTNYKVLGKLDLSVDDVFQAVSGVHRRVRGAYAVVIMIAGFGILGFRDPHGIQTRGIWRENNRTGL